MFAVDEWKGLIRAKATEAAHHFGSEVINDLAQDITVKLLKDGHRLTSTAGIVTTIDHFILDWGRHLDVEHRVYGGGLDTADDSEMLSAAGDYGNPEDIVIAQMRQEAIAAAMYRHSLLAGAIYERVVLGGESLESVGSSFSISRRTITRRWAEIKEDLREEFDGWL